MDAVELEFAASLLTYSPDFVDTRVFPDLEYPANAGANWHQLPNLDPTDIYGPAGLFWHTVYGDLFASGVLDGETFLGLAEHTDVDAIQFFSITGEPWRIDGLLYSVDLWDDTPGIADDAPDGRDAFGNWLNPGWIYLSWLDGCAPIPYKYIGGDVDAIVWAAGAIPEPATVVIWATLAGLALIFARMRKARW